MTIASDISLTAMALRAGTCPPDVQKAVFVELQHLAAQVARMEEALDGITESSREDTNRPVGTLLQFPASAQRRPAAAVPGEVWR